MSEVGYDTMTKVLKELIREVVKEELGVRTQAVPSAARPANGGTQPQQAQNGKPNYPPMRECPKCGKKSVIKGKPEFGGGFVCWKGSKVGGCGAKFTSEDQLAKQYPTQDSQEPDYEETPY